MRRILNVLGVTVLAAAASSCGDVVRQGASPVYLVIDSLAAAQGSKPTQFSANLMSDVITNATSPPPCTADAPCPTIFNDIGQAKIRLSLKDPGANPASPASPSSLNDVTLSRYHVEYRRADGRNTPGVDVPYAFDGGVTGTIAGGAATTFSFEIVRHVAKQESPLVQLIASPTVITTIATVTFYGRDQAGNEITVSGTITIDFGNFGDV